MNWNLTVDGQPGTVGNNLIAAVYDPSNPSSYPLSPAAFHVISGPFPGAFNFTLTGLSAIVYNFVLWDTSTTTPGTGTARNPFSLQPTLQTLQVRTDLYLTADASPGLLSGNPTYTDPTSSLAGWPYSLEEIGYGTLQVAAGNDYTVDSTTGNWTLINGSTPNPGQKYVVHFLPIVSNQPISVTAPSIVSSYRLITANTTLTSADMGKLIALQGAGPGLIVTLPSISSVSDNQSIFFNSSGGNHINAVIQAAGSDHFQWLQFSNQVTPQTQMILGQSEQMLLIKAAGIWNVVQVSETVKMVGEIVWNYSKQPINTIQAAGQLLLRASYPRLYNYFLSLESSTVTSEALWPATLSADGATYKKNNQLWTPGDGSTNFRIPLLSTTNVGGTGFLRIIDGTVRTPGSFQLDAQPDHQHDSLIGEFPGDPNGNGPSRTVGRYNGTQVSKSDLSSNPGLVVAGTFQLATKVAYESRPINIGVYGLLRI